MTTILQRRFLSILIGLLVVSVISFVLIISKLDPFQGIGNIFLFYVNLFVLSLTLSTLTAFYARQSIGQREFAPQYLLVSFRQGLWFSLLIVVALTLQSFGFFTLTNAVFLILALVFLESYFLYK